MTVYTVILIIFSVVGVIGLGTVFWSAMGLLRLVIERQGGSSLHRAQPTGPSLDEVAVLIAAHNEELTIGRTLESVGALIPLRQVFVISDGSSDRTAEIVTGYGANLLELNPNRGKAGALAAGVAHFRLRDTFEVVMLLDADTEPDEHYFETGLPLFAEPDVVAVAGRAATAHDFTTGSLASRILVAYRERLYVLVQLMMKYGQAFPTLNVVSIVPGFASMYRTRILDDIDIAAPGLVIEDFNMTFEVHAKRLGRVAFHPQAAIAYTQDPDNLRDYVKQVQRWVLGFWQTVRRHRLHRGAFWVALAVYIVELLLSCLLWVLLIPVLVLSSGAGIIAALHPGADPGLELVSGVLPPLALLVGVVLPDLVLTVFAAVVTRRTVFLRVGLAFPLLKILDAVLCFRSLVRLFTATSTGRWTSPSRRPVAATAASGAGTAPPAQPSSELSGASGGR